MDDEVRKVVEEMRKAIAEWRYGKATVYQADMVNTVVDWADRLKPPVRLWVKASAVDVEWEWSARNPDSTALGGAKWIDIPGATRAQV